MPFLANGGAIYGGQSNQIEDCLFQDLPYGCGILISTTFPVGINAFSGTTVAQRCDLNRCGGYDAGWTWRAALQLCLENKSLSGINLNNLNITNSISDGLSIVAPGSSVSTGLGTLSNATMANVSIPNYGIGVSGRHGLWARSDAIGSMTVSNSTVVEYRNDSANFTFVFVTNVTATASFTATPTNGGAPLTVTFTDTSTGTITNRFWSFDDGATTNTTLTSLLHTYQFPGTYTVRLIASGASGSSTNTQTNLIVATSVDTIGDGIPNWWRAQYFGGNGSTTNASSCATCDFTGTGQNNLFKYVADLNPANSDSRLAFLSLSVVTNDANLVWIGGSNAWQSVERSSNLADTNAWSAIFTNPPPTPVTNALPHTDAGSATNLFYRIKAWRLP